MRRPGFAFLGLFLCSIFACQSPSSPSSPSGPGTATTATFLVTYLPNGAQAGTVPTDTFPYSQGAKATVLGNTGGLSRSGFSFDGWNTLSDGSGTDYAPGSVITIGTTNVSLFAKGRP